VVAGFLGRGVGIIKAGMGTGVVWSQANPGSALSALGSLTRSMVGCHNWEGVMRHGGRSGIGSCWWVGTWVDGTHDLRMEPARK